MDAAKKRGRACSSLRTLAPDRVSGPLAEAMEGAGGVMEQLGRLQKLQAALVRCQTVAAVLGVLL